MEKIDYSLPTEGIKLKATTPSISEISERERERSIEKLKQGVEASSQSRSKVVSVFERAGKPLSLSLDTKPSKSLPISIESGVEKVSYDPKGNNADTGGVIPAFTYGDRQVRDAQGEVGDAQDRVDRNGRQVILANQQYIDAQNAYNQAQIDSNNFYNNPENRAALTPGWDALDNGQAQWTYNRNNGWILVATPNSPISQSTLDRFNTVSQSGDQLNYRVDQTYRNQISAQDRQQYIIDGLQENQRYLDYTRNILSTEERNRYRYIAGGIDFDKKVLESMKIFTELYGKKYSKDEIINQYNNSFDALGGLMTRIQKGGIITEADYKKEIGLIGASLSKEEKMIFLGLIGANLNSLTYNQDMARSGNLGAVKPFESMQALASAFASGKQVPAGVCGSIHIAVASMAESWGIPAGTMTVSTGGVGHVVAILDIDGKKVISDYGKIYTAKTMEELIDTYAIGNKGAVLKNYITDANGKIIGHIDTPLTKAFRRETLSELDISRYIADGGAAQDGVKINLYGDRKGIRGQHTLQNGVYLRGSYTEATLIKGVSAKTIKAAVGKEWKDIDLSSGWKGSSMAELSIAQSRLSYSGVKSEQRANVLQAQAGFRGEKDLGNGSTLYAGAGVRIIGQGSKPGSPDYATLGPLGTGVSAEAGLNTVIGINHQISPDTKISGEYGIQTHKGPNVQGLSKKDLNPLGAGYSESTIKLGVETKIGSDSILSSTYTNKKGPISEEKTVGLGYSTNNIGVNIEKAQIRGTHIFGATSQDIIRARIEGKLSENGTWFLGGEKGGIEGKKVTAGAKWTF